MDFNTVNTVYMLGIGGIGMSGLARWLKLNRRKISGYDKTRTPLTDALNSEGIPVVFEFDADAVNDADLLVITPAVPRDNPVLARALERGIPVMKRAELLGWLSRNFHTAGIAGTHGKTTTTGLTTWLTRKGGVDCSAFIGGIVKNFDSNFVHGNSDWLVVEADEFDRSFLQLDPQVGIITSVDPDHLDIYGTPADVESGYAAYAAKVKPGGTLLLNDRLRSFSQRFSLNALFYGLADADFRGENLRLGKGGTYFDYVSEKETIKDLWLSIPGRYNVENALAAITAARIAGASWEGIREGLATFRGIGRRFDVQYLSAQIAYVDDYAHHPEEIRSLLSAVKDQFPGWRSVAIFQPHLYTRTRDFAEGFAESLSLADEVVLLEIYPARELPIEGVTSSMLLGRIHAKRKAIATMSELPGLVRDNIQDKTIFLTIGAGDIDNCIEPIRKMLEMEKP